MKSDFTLIQNWHQFLSIQNSDISQLKLFYIREIYFSGQFELGVFNQILCNH